jgi:Family of unknown function (DUF5996)
MSDWPELPYAEWVDTRNTLHRWMQVVGKIRLELTPLVNHWWNVTFYLTARGLTTSAIPYGDRWFEMEFDFLSHLLRIRTSDGQERDIALVPRTVASFYAEVLATLKSLGLEVSIWPMPVEIAEDPIRLDQDEEHHSYDPEQVQRFWTLLALTEGVLTKFRSEFIGKCSPIHFFWGGIDLAVTRFSGRRAPEREGANPIDREAYSHEVSSVGFWPGDGRLERAAFYSYAAPEPDGFRDSPVSPPEAYYDPALGGFYLTLDDLRRSADPEKTLLEFCRTTYVAAAEKAKWDRDALERKT